MEHAPEYTIFLIKQSSINWTGLNHIKTVLQIKWNEIKKSKAGKYLGYS